MEIPEGMDQNLLCNVRDFEAGSLEDGVTRWLYVPKPQAFPCPSLLLQCL